MTGTLDAVAAASETTVAPRRRRTGRLLIGVGIVMQFLPARPATGAR